MEHIGIDLGKSESQLCIRTSDLTIVLEQRVRNDAIARILSRRPKGARVIVESSAEAFAVADIAKACGHDPRVIPATLARTIGIGARRQKNDQRDARAMSEASCRTELPSVHVPTVLSRERKAMCTSREALIRVRVELTNTLDGYLRTRMLRSSVRGASPRFSATLREDLGTSMEPHVECLLASIDAINAQLEVLDERLVELAKNDPDCSLLMTMPGVGPVIAMRFVSAIDDPHRFTNAAQVANYLGLTPGENTTGFAPRPLGITKAGAPRVRWALTQGAWSLYRCRKGDPMVQWALKIEARSSRKKAITALARKMSGVLWAMWRDGSPYSPDHASKATSSTE